MYAASIGYPIGYSEQNFVIELNGTTKKVPFEMASIWMQLNGIKEVDDITEAKKEIDKLIYLELLVLENDEDALMNKIMSRKVVRQGAGSVFQNEIAIFLGNNYVKPNEMQYDIWKLSNGTRTLRDIKFLIDAKFKAENIEFYKSVAFLCGKDLIFIV